MLPLPWWILGVGPEEQVEDDDDAVPNKVEKSFEVQSSDRSTPISMFRTPSTSPVTEKSDNLPKVVDLSTFLNVAKRRSSSRLEAKTPKIRKVAERPLKAKKNKSFERKETEIMNKSSDGQSIVDFDETARLFSNETDRSGSPMPRGDDLNNTFRLEESETEKSGEGSSSMGSTEHRDYPLFFSSFDDTTVVFNNTIAGDIDLHHRHDAVGDWVFKTNEFLQENKTSESESTETSPFKAPIKKGKKTRGRPKVETTKSEVLRGSASRGKQGAGDKLEKIETPSRPRAPPTMERRQTPSRKAKTYKNLKE